MNKYVYRLTDDNKIKRINVETGAFTLMPLASEKQREYLANLRQELGLKPAKYKLLPMHRASTLIKKYQSTLEEKRRQTTIFS